MREKTSTCLEHDARTKYKSNMKSQHSTPGDERHAQDQGTSLHPQVELCHVKRSASSQTDSTERQHQRSHGLKVTSSNLDNQTLHLTVRLQAGEEGDEEENQGDEEIGGLINSDGEIVEWDARDCPNQGINYTEGPQLCSKGAVLSESPLRGQGQKDGCSPAFNMEVVSVGEDGEREEKGDGKIPIISTSCRGKKWRRKKNAEAASSGSSDPERNLPENAAKNISEAEPLSDERFDAEPGISRRTRRKRTLRTKVNPEGFTSKPFRRVDAKHLKRRKDTTISTEEQEESTGLKSGKKRPGRKMVRVPIEIPPELLKKPKEKMEYHCSVCGKEFPHAYKLERHELIHTGEKPYCCSICGRGFNQKGNLKTHYKVHVGRKGAVDFDNEVNPMTSEFSQYLKSLPGESRIRSTLRCLDCGKECESQSALEAHNVTAHTQSTGGSDVAEHSVSEILFCRRCRVQFTEKDKLDEHIKTHIKDKPYSCPDCGKRFINESYIQIHQRIHTGEKPFLCSQCGRGFHTSSSLKLHEMQHSGERPFACKICGKTFRINSYLTAHYQTHIKDRPFICSVCGKGYSRAEELKVHHRLHTGERPYECAECGKSFIYRQGLRQHQRTHAGRRIGPTRQLGRPKQHARLDN